MLKQGERIDDLQLKELKIIQNPDMFCFGIDAVLLSSFAKIRKNDKVADLGCGNGIIPILLYGKYAPKEIIGVEIQTEVCEMAQRSINLNSLEDTIKLYNGDIKHCYKNIGINSFDVVVTNPPYKKMNTGLKNGINAKTIARHEVLITLEDIIFTASKLLKVGGSFYMIHRPERIKDIIIALNNEKITLKKIRFVHSKQNVKPTMVLIHAVKAGGEFLVVDKPLIIYNEDNSYTDEINSIYGRC